MQSRRATGREVADRARRQPHLTADGSIKISRRSADPPRGVFVAVASRRVEPSIADGRFATHGRCDFRDRRYRVTSSHLASDGSAGGKSGSPAAKAQPSFSRGGDLPEACPSVGELGRGAGSAVRAMIAPYHPARVPRVIERPRSGPGASESVLATRRTSQPEHSSPRCAPDRE
jgi:hypothetical protein